MTQDASGSHVTVNVVTPFYNTADHLGECIESVLGQTFEDFEYLLADNRSTDGSREIAETYARQDSRIRLLTFDEHLPQIPNYNRALRQLDRSAKYFKFLAADDALFPHCIEEMVRMAESDDDIVMVGSYSLTQNSVFLDGLDYYERVLAGRELCRRYLLDGPYILGNPSTSMFRMREVEAREDFYPEQTWLGDADVAMQILTGGKFGFVHQVLAFIRKEKGSISHGIEDFNIDALSRRVLLEKYGRLCLDPATFERQRRRLINRHYRVLGEGLLLRRPAGFWNLHRVAMADAGLSISGLRLSLGALIVAVRWLVNPEASLRGV